jgi:hypothetical protein
MRAGAAPVLVAALALAACSDDSGNFSQEPGFAAWYAAHPPAGSEPTPAERALLERYRPRIFLPEGHPGPIDFYRDYIAHGTLRDAAGAPISSAVTPEILNAHRHDPGVVFTYRAAGAPGQPVIYGRVDRGELALPDCTAPLPVTFLSWHLVFARSGLPAALPVWQAALLGALGDLDDWHQLDHYTALSLALAPDRSGALLPFAVTFQHHNYLRTYLLGQPPGAGRLPLPPDGRLGVDVALRSNELDPHQAGRILRRAVSFMTPASARYLVEGVDRPWLAADDVTDPVVEIDPELRFLPPADAFYVFEGGLGERRLLPGRDGPPGADYNTLPAFKSKAVQLALFYWAEDASDYLETIAPLFAKGQPSAVAPEPFNARLARDAPAGSPVAGCSAAAPPPPA